MDLLQRIHRASEPIPARQHVFDGPSDVEKADLSGQKGRDRRLVGCIEHDGSKPSGRQSLTRQA